MRNETTRVCGWVKVNVVGGLFYIGDMGITVGFQLQPIVKVNITTGFEVEPTMKVHICK